MKLHDGDPRRTEFIKALESDGWEVNTEPKLDWWLDQQWWIADVWAATSVWSPHGFKIFMIWTNDDTVAGLLPDRPNVKTFFQSSQSRSSEARSFDELDKGPALCLHHWPRELPGFLNKLSEVRAAIARHCQNNQANENS